MSKFGGTTLEVDVAIAGDPDTAPDMAAAADACLATHHGGGARLANANRLRELQAMIEDAVAGLAQANKAASLAEQAVAAARHPRARAGAGGLRGQSRGRRALG